MIHPKYNASSRYFLMLQGNVLDLGCSSTVASSQFECELLPRAVWRSPAPSFLAERDHLFLSSDARAQQSFAVSTDSAEENAFGQVQVSSGSLPCSSSPQGCRSPAEQDSNQNEQPHFSESPYLCQLRATVKLQPEGKGLTPPFCTSALKTLLLDSLSQQSDD